MNVLLKGLLLVALVLLVSTEAQRSYESLDSKYKIHVDKALEKVNTGTLGVNHANFHLIQEPLRISGDYYVNIILKSTKCKKEHSNYGHRKECEPVNWHFIDCVVCKTNYGELVDCVFLRDVKKCRVCLELLEGYMNHVTTWRRDQGVSQLSLSTALVQAKRHQHGRQMPRKRKQEVHHK